MSFLDTLWSRGRKETPVDGFSSISLAEMERDFDIIKVVDEPGQQFAIVAAKGNNFEIGSSSASPYTSFVRQEYNPALMGIKGLEVYDKMRKSDGTVRGTLRSIKTPALAGRWFVEPAAPGYQTAEDIERYKLQAHFVWCNLTEYMSISWPQVLTEALLMADFGYYMFEKVWENRLIEGEMRTVLSKLGPRHPMDVQEWFFDAHGGPVKVRMNPPTMNDINTFVDIPIEKMLVFTFDREAGNIEGISVLRSAYKHWYFIEQLYKIDAIQKERHGIGIPVIKLPMGFKDEDKAAAENLGRNIRTNERAHIVLPPGWEIFMLKLEGNPVDALDSVEHHQTAIRENILVNFIAEAAREEDLTMFLKASRFVADIVAETFNHYLIPQMIRYNWPLEEKYPKLRVRRIGENADWRTMSFAIRNLIGAGVIIPDETLEANIREEMDLPTIDKETARLIATPQNPYDINEDVEGDELEIGRERGDAADPDSGDSDDVHNRNSPRYNRNRRRKPGRKQRGQVAGLPRQSLPRNQRAGRGTVPGRNAGTDRSGG